VVLVLVALRAGWSTYQRTAALWWLSLGPQPYTVEGVVTEALEEERRETLPPFPLKVYVVRYAFPAPPLGTMLNGEQVVTARQFARIGQQGDPLPVTFDPTAPQRNAALPGVAFPAHAGVWATITVMAVWGALGAFTIALSRSRVRATSHRE
jgi:hypothetical protein